jgi:hypothetical protein
VTRASDTKLKIDRVLRAVLGDGNVSEIKGDLNSHEHKARIIEKEDTSQHHSTTSLLKASLTTRGHIFSHV